MRTLKGLLVIAVIGGAVWVTVTYPIHALGAAVIVGVVGRWIWARREAVAQHDYDVAEAWLAARTLIELRMTGQAWIGNEAVDELRRSASYLPKTEALVAELDATTDHEFAKQIRRAGRWYR